MQFLNTEEKPRRAAVINDLSGAGKCSLTVMLPVLSALGCETSVLPTAVLSTHGGFKDPVYRDLTDDMLKTAQHWKREGAEFEGICSGYLSSREQIDTMREIFELFTDEHSRPLRLVDPVMGDNGKAYATVTPELIRRIRQLCRSANLILPNYTEAQLLLQRTPVDDPLDDAAAQALADELTALAPSAVVTGLPLGKYIGCAGSGRERFVIKKLHISRSFPGTGDLYGAVLIGSLIQGNALSAAADNAAEFVSLAIQQTPADQDTRYGVWFEPLLPRLCPVSWND